MRKNRGSPSGHTVDIAVIGGGMVGSAAALALSRLGYSVAVIEAGQAPGFPGDVHELRVSAISPASARLLDELGAWAGIMAHRTSPYERMFVWDAGGYGSVSFDAADIGLPQLGHIIENATVHAALVERIRAGGQIRYLVETRIADIQWQDSGNIVRLDDGRQISCALLVGADGGNSQLRRAAGLGTRGHPYHQTAIVANVQTELPHDRTAWQRFLATGPLAFLPLSDGSCSIVWSADDPLARELLALDETVFERRLEEAFASRLGAVKLASQRAGFPLLYANSESYSAHRLALVGDAAHRIHPLAGQGVNLGLGDVVELAAALGQARLSGRDAGDAMYLRRYARARRAQATMMMVGMDGIQHLFGSDNRALMAARNAGLRMVDNSMLLKGFFMYQAAAERYRF
jgi:ubiquinone biosynthesis UbiH/UbiF/VisC/COQ6 family hydroxylase